MGTTFSANNQEDLSSKDYVISFEHNETEEEVRQKYNREADYESSVLEMGWDATFEVFFEMLQTNKIQFNACFDGGCGPGNLGKQVKTRFPKARLYGQDLSDTQVEIARKKDIYEKLQQGSLKKGIMKMPEEVDLAWFNGVFGYITNPEVALENLTSKLAATATIFISMRRYQFDETLSSYIKNDSRFSIIDEKLFASLPNDPEHTKKCQYYGCLLKFTNSNPSVSTTA